MSKDNPAKEEGKWDHKEDLGLKGEEPSVTKEESSYHPAPSQPSSVSKPSFAKVSQLSFL